MSDSGSFNEALQRLLYQAEIGCWYTKESIVPVRIGDLYEVFKELKRRDSEIKLLKDKQ